MDSYDERQTVRELAFRVLEIAKSRENAEVINRWKNVNERRKADRFPIWCKPVGCWNELLPAASLVCSGTAAGEIERTLKKILVKNEIGDDTPVYPYYSMDRSFACEPDNVWGVWPRKASSGQAGGAWGYLPGIRDMEELPLLRKPVFRYDHEETERKKEQIEELIGDILPVKLQCTEILSGTLGTYLADLMGLTEMMENMIKEPDFVHAVMRLIRDSVLDSLDMLERENLVAPDYDDAMICSEPFGHSDSGAGLKNCWMMANSQEFDQVSPAMWEEFCLAYQLPVFARYGRVAYGCCENLTRKIDGVLSIPNLHIFVCSAWTDLQKVVSAVGGTKVIMWRQKASEVVFENDWRKIKAHLAEGVKTLKRCHGQIVLRELETLNGNLRRLHEWVEVAKDVCGA